MINRFIRWCDETTIKLQQKAADIRAETGARKRAHEEIKARLQTPTLRWTTNKPTAPGQYWAEDAHGESVVSVQMYRGELLVYCQGSEEGFSVLGDTFIQRWSGPLSRPRS